MKKRFAKYIAILTLVPVLFLTGCGQNPIFEFDIMNELLGAFEEPSSHTTPEIPEDYVKPELPAHMNEAYIHFSIELFKRSLTSGENSLISPASAEFALTMAAMGASGSTQDEMLTVLCPGYTLEDLTSYAGNLSDSLTYSNMSSFHIANSMWTNEAILGDCLNETYADTLKEEMNAEATMLPFNDRAVKEINNWVEDNTNGMIPTLLQDISPEAAMYLINAMAFEAEWSDQYSEYQIHDEIFTNAAGVEENARMLRETGRFYLENDDATGFIKFYEGGEYAFLAMLPNEEGAIEDFVANMTTEDYMTFWSSMTRDYDVRTALPCFSYSYDTLMNDALIDMGMTTAFSEGAADFSPMVTDENVDLYINRVIHKTFIELDENGTKAAAVTAIEMYTESAMIEDPREVKEVILDRPFVYAIVEASSGLPIFIGTVNSVAE